jgi:hypothetical protein
MNNRNSTGGCIKSWCPRCNLKSDHTIISIVADSPKQIKCNVCDEHHTLSAKPSGKSRTKQNSSARNPRAKEATYQEHLSRLTGGDPANSTKYHIKGNYIKDEIIHHLSFGIGIVLSVINFSEAPRLQGGASNAS